MLGLALVCTALAFLLFFALIAEVGPARSTVITYVNPAVAVLLGVVVLGEAFTVASPSASRLASRLGAGHGTPARADRRNTARLIALNTSGLGVRSSLLRGGFGPMALAVVGETERAQTVGTDDLGALARQAAGEVLLEVANDATSVWRFHDLVLSGELITARN